MGSFDRDEPVWYYQLGGKALGPVPWSEIEALLEDAFDAEELLVARAGDDEWRSAQKVIDEFEEDEAGAATAEEEADEPAGEREEKPREPLTPVHGLRAWIRQAWEIVTDDFAGYVGGAILLVALSAVSVMVCFPALHAGLYVLALKRFRGEKLESGDFIRGFQFFGRALGLYLVLFLIGLPFGLLAILGVALGIVAVGGEPGAQTVLGMFTTLLWLAVGLSMAFPGAAGFFAMPLMLDRDMGAMEALAASWAVTKGNYLSYLGMTIVLMLLSGAGALLCWVGVVLTLPLLPAAQVCVYGYHFREAARAA